MAEVETGRLVHVIFVGGSDRKRNRAGLYTLFQNHKGCTWWWMILLSVALTQEMGKGLHMSVF